MSDKIYFITDDSCEPLDPEALSICSMDKGIYLQRYGNTDWAFDSHKEASEFVWDNLE